MILDRSLGVDSKIKDVWKNPNIYLGRVGFMEIIDGG
jgi:hypothetical protein